MDETRLRSLMVDIRDGSLSTEDALEELRRLPFADLGFAKIDHHRELRQSIPEAVYAPGKTVQQCVDIVGEMLAHGSGPVVVTRANNDQRQALLATHPDAHGETTTLYWRPYEQQDGLITIATAGTGDLPVANECATVLGALGYRLRSVDDCGVAGVHRLLSSLSSFEDADVVVVVAGMEGALASVVGGLVKAPVIAVPTSVGYGTSFEGITALLGMLSSCAPGLSVVGIDNGFGAACAAARILKARS